MNTRPILDLVSTSMNIYLHTDDPLQLAKIKTVYFVLKHSGNLYTWNYIRRSYNKTVFGKHATPIFNQIEEDM